MFLILRLKKKEKKNNNFLYKSVAIYIKMYYNIIKRTHNHNQKGNHDMAKNIKLAAICAACVLALTACSGENKNETSNTSSSTSSTMSNTVPPEGYVDNTSTDSNTLDYTDDELYAGIGSEKKAMVRDEKTFINGEGFQYRFATNLLTTEKQDNVVCIEDAKDKISKFVIGGHEYAYGDLVRDKTQGIEIIKLFAKDFGINKCDEKGNLVERLGDIQDTDGIRNAYSDRVEYDDYTACAYYFDAKLNSFDDATYEKCREKYAEKHKTDTGANLDGVLGVILYYDKDGNDYFYSIILSAPTYYNDEKNFEANMDNNLRKDVTNCHVEFSDGLKVGFINKTAIMCTKMP